MVILIVTLENSGIDRYSQELSKRIRVPTIESRRYLSLRDSLRFVRRLRQTPYPVHFTTQHFARHGLFLGKTFIVTVHDLVRICFPFTCETIPEKLVLRLDAFGLKKAQHIIAVSEYTKADLTRYLKIPEGKITVIYDGVDHGVFKPVPGRCFDFPYLLYVGTERPRKNLETLLKAFLFLKRETMAPRNLKLVKCGSAGRTERFRRTTLDEIRHFGLEDEVIFTEYTSDENLAIYYSSASALVMPSLYEGFGLPVIEAMACGCPVIASNCSSLPEVAGGAALLFSAQDHIELAQALHDVVTEPDLRYRLVTKGLIRAKYFSWETTAKETLKVYRRVIDELDARGLP